MNTINFMGLDNFKKINDYQQKRAMLYTYITMWIAWSSNLKISIDEIKEKLTELLDYFSNFDDQSIQNFSYHIQRVYLNRNNDFTLLKSLFTIENLDISIICLQLLNDANLNIKDKVDLDVFFDNLKSRFNNLLENKNYLYLRLQYLTVDSERYKANENEVIAILQKLN